MCHGHSGLVSPRHLVSDMSLSSLPRAKASVSGWTDSVDLRSLTLVLNALQKAVVVHLHEGLMSFSNRVSYDEGHLSHFDH